jgi:hypothetical protein
VAICPGAIIGGSADIVRLLSGRIRHQGAGSRLLSWSARDAAWGSSVRRRSASVKPGTVDRPVRAIIRIESIAEGCLAATGRRSVSRLGYTDTLFEELDRALCGLAEVVGLAKIEYRVQA